MMAKKEQTEDAPKKRSPFDYINQISFGKQDLLEEDGGEYSPFLTSRYFSYFVDTVLPANEINKYGGQLTARMHHDYLMHAIPPRKRFTKWLKKADEADVELIAKHFKCSRGIARNYAKIMGPEDLEELRSLYETGGKG